MKPIFIDFETFWSQTHSLTKIHPVEYVMHPETEIQSVAIKEGLDGETFVLFGEDEIKAWADRTDFSNTILIGHNMAGFDAMICAWRFGIRPKAWSCTLAIARALGYAKTVGGSLKRVASDLDLGAKLDLEATNTKGKKLADFTPEEIELMRTYNVVDTDLCAGIFRKLAPKLGTRELKLIDMTIRMLVEPQFEMDEALLVRTLAEIKEKQKQTLLAVSKALLPEVDTLLSEDELIEQAKKVLASAPKFAKFLESKGVPVPMKESPSNPEKQIPALAKTDEEFLALQEHDDFEVAAAASARLGVKSTILESRIEQFLRCGRAVGGRMPIALNYYGADTTGRWCLTGDHEVLTRNGWVRLDQWDDQDDILQWDDLDDALSFAPASANRFYTDEQLIKYDNPRHSAIYTPDHTMPVKAHHSDNIVRAKAGDVARAKRQLVVSSRVLESRVEAYDHWVLRLIIAMHADGYNAHDEKNNMVRFRFTKPRKISRIKFLLEMADVPYRQACYASEPGVTVILISGDDAPEWLRSAKKLPDDFYTLGYDEIEVVMDEIKYWDAYQSGSSSYEYITCDKDAMEKISTLAHMSGHRTTVREVDRSDMGWSLSWRVSFHKNKFLTISKKDATLLPFKGYVYCPTTTTGFFLCRRDKSIFVTGNSGTMKMNQQNLPRVNPSSPKPSDALRKCLVAPKGKKVVVADLSGIELRVNHFLWKEPDSMKLFQADPEKADLYKDFASKLYKKSWGEVTKAERQVGKVAHLGLGFGAGAATFQKVARLMGGVDLSLEESEEIVSKWRNEYGRIASGWRTCHDALANIHYKHYNIDIDPWGLCKTAEGGIKTPLGMIRYPDLRQETNEETGRSEWVYGHGRKKARIYAGKVTENIVQHLAREALSDMMLKIQERYPIAHTVHDEVILVVDEAEAQEALDFMQEIMRGGVTWWPELVTWSEGGVSTTYGDAKD